MKRGNKNFRLAFAAGLMWTAMPTAYALTAAGTDVSNSATVDYSVSGVPQTQKLSNTVTFKVDRVIDLAVAESGGAATGVAPSATSPDTLLVYTVTNNSNSILDFNLAATQQVGGAAPFNGETDNFDVTAPSVFVEDGTTPGFQATEDTATFIDELVPTDSATVYVVSTIPANRVDGDAAVIVLTATARLDTDVTGDYVASPGAAGAAAAQTNVGSVDDVTFIDTVFGDAAGAIDAARNAAHSARDQYNVVSASIAITKSSRVVSDPLNGISANAKAIPGAVVEYCLDVDNTGAAAAGSIVLRDLIPTNTAYVLASIRTAATGALTACDSGSGVAEDDDASNADESDPDGGDYDVTNTGEVTIVTPSIAAGSRFKALFRVTIQ